jgi:hypothetical protein
MAAPIVLPRYNQYEGLQQGLLNFVQGREANMASEQRRQFLAKAAMAVGLGPMEIPKDPTSQQLVINQIIQAGKPTSASEGIARLKLNRINEIMATPEQDRSAQDKAELISLRGGGGINFATDLQKGTMGAIETDMKDTSVSLSALKGIMESYKPEYLDLYAPVKAKLGHVASKVGFPKLFGKDNRKFTDERDAFMQGAYEAFVKFRKQITGVAGGMQELQMIAKAFPDVQDDDPKQFESKANAAIRNSERALRVLDDMKKNGIDINQTNFTKAVKEQGIEWDLPKGFAPGTASQDVATAARAALDAGTINAQEYETALRADPSRASDVLAYLNEIQQGSQEKPAGSAPQVAPQATPRAQALPGPVPIHTPANIPVTNAERGPATSRSIAGIDSMTGAAPRADVWPPLTSGTIDFIGPSGQLLRAPAGVSSEYISNLLGQGFSVPGAITKQNNSDKAQTVSGMRIEPRRWVISFNRGATWQKVR